MWKKRARRVLPWLLAVVAVATMRDELFRPVWFDEAITATEFAALPSIPDIYRQYTIPNNHILFTIMTSLWMDALCLCGIWVSDMTLRIFPAMLSMAAAVMVCVSSRGPLGRWAAFPVAAAFAMSPPFSIYSVALRGYMASFLVVFLACVACGRILSGKRPAARDGALYFILCLAACGIMPSNVVALCAGAAMLAVWAGRGAFLSARGAFVLLAPPAATLLFYLPIFDKLLRVSRLGEGWGSRLDSLSSFYISALVSFLPILAALAVWAVRTRSGKATKKFVAGVAVLAMIPAATAMVLATPPFPRIFFPLWAVMVFAMIHGMRMLLAGAGRNSAPKIALVLAAAAIGWGLVGRMASETLSEALTPRESMDDYFKPYYTREDFNPRKTMAAIIEANKERETAAYVTFQADPYSIRFYWLTQDKVDKSLLLFDGPRRKITRLPDSCLIVARDDRDLKEAMDRLGVARAAPVDTKGRQKTYRVLGE